MAKKNYYAIRKGTATGIFSTWEECRNATAGYSGAEFQGFATREEAEAYLGETQESGKEEDLLIAYVDGSFRAQPARYAFGCVLLLPSGEEYTLSGSGEQADSLAIRNVAGEMLGAMSAVLFALKNGFSRIELRYDYEGIEKWVTGVWKAKQPLTQRYAASMRGWGARIGIQFRKVAAHSGNAYNDRADALAKAALEGPAGIPEIPVLAGGHPRSVPGGCQEASETSGSQPSV